MKTEIFILLLAYLARSTSHLVGPPVVPVVEINNTILNVTKVHAVENLLGICKDVEAKCVPLVSCPAHVRNQMKDVPFCEITSSRKGVCCKTGHNHTDATTAKGRLHGLSTIKSIDVLTMNAVTHHSRAQMSILRSREVDLLSGRNAVPILEPGSASYGHYRNSRAFNFADLSEVMNVANRALEIAIATRAFKDRQGITNEQLELGNVQQDLRPTSMGHTCTPRPYCLSPPDKYRRIEGACNNLFQTSWGTPLSPYARLLPPNYQDGVWSPRVSVVNGAPLPSTRLISTTIFSDKNIPNPTYTLMIMQFGQFLSHDITQSIDSTFGNGSAISCCSEDGSEEIPVRYRHFACMPIEIPKTDKFYSRFNQRCMNFVRSVLAPKHDCTLGYAEQMNKITHFIDSSNIYGSTPEQTRELRSFEGGRLTVFKDFGRDLLPLSKDTDACLTMEQGSACFSSGDTRTNQMISLVVLHTVFMREHNRIADQLKYLNPTWDDELLFLQARQVMMAQMQVIVYKEFLPALLGEAAMEEFQLHLRPYDEYAFDYDPNMPAAVTNEFASAAYRFGHSIVDGLMKIYGPKRMEEVISIPEVMFQPARMRKQLFLDEILSTLTTEPIQETDTCISETLTQYMFRAGGPFGVDLVSLNIQRGRDHGLRCYNDYRELVGLPKLTDFNQFKPEFAEKLKSVYASVDDVDLWVGGLIEEKAPGSLVGPTFRDIIADQFVRLKRGDKYFFENDPSINPGHFNPGQLRELKKASLSRIICDNSDGILLARQAPNAFRQPGVPGNEYVDCLGPEIPKVDLMFWKD